MINIILNVWNVVLIVVGFGLVIVIHELGHFAAARWAGIRCHAFAVGFGPAIVSWRRGLGMRRGSSDAVYRRMLANAGGNPSDLPAVSPTEYRLNFIPFGGYVKMLGQEDIDPSARSDAPDSYQCAKVWKRMIVISAGVIANVILAAILFMVVFSSGIKEPAPIIGYVVDNSPADRAGMLPGDVVTAVNGKAMTFSDLRIAAAMSGKGESITFDINRDGETLTIQVTPEKKNGMPSIGVSPLTSLTITDDVHRASARAELIDLLGKIGLEGTAPGDTIIAVNGVTLPRHDVDGVDTGSLLDLQEVIRASDGAPIVLTIQPHDGGATLTRTLMPIVELQLADVEIGDAKFGADHVLGLMPLMGVFSTDDHAAEQGLRAGDVFVHLGDTHWPGVADGIAQIRAHKNKAIETEVLRDGEVIALTLAVNGKGQVGFNPTAARNTNLLARTPETLLSTGWDGKPLTEVAAHRLLPAPVAGSGIVAINGQATATFVDVVLSLQQATSDAAANGTGADVALDLQLPGVTNIEHRTWSLTAIEVTQLHELQWEIPRLDSTVMGWVEHNVKASGPIEALGMGFHRTKRVVLLTYLTFKRLFEGQLAVEQLRGPVGIAHTGFYFAERGIIWVLFFLAMVSANLAVVNFLPIPIADGGQFLLLCWEGLRGRPAPVAVQNVMMLAGLVLIVGLFLFITFHDVVRLLG